MIYLFIGGEQDGKLINIRDEGKPVTIPKKSYQGIEKEAVENEEYKRIELIGNATAFGVYALRGMSPDNAIHQLIQNYRPESDHDLQNQR